ncbi:Branched-chain amino acid ABC transporter, amino acid-binding protein [Desulfurella amilsii]|uniref:Branched-chain amino acid ABC transporter, amino acid-binding protein n=1 Tax=Desulfurella amilsii TaxID=1562698 RepID=A0A1X4Y031_9BACT|nr:ABC transporter substrate-binding protein [Desulfurella amilsii]OSS43152.1 Branched-chain amino acid ABC transporter, amino acid-binding protein [Desulfurella amilsii]
MKSTLFKTVLFVLAAVFTFGFGANKSLAAQSTIKVGVVFSMTGPIAAFGQSSWDGLQVAKEIMPTALGKKIDLILVDDQGDKVQAANAVNKLVYNNKVDAIIGPLISGNVMSATPIVEKAKIPLITPTGTSPLLTQGKNFISRACFIDPFQGKVAAIYAVKNLHAKTAAIVIDSAQDYSVGLAKFFEENFKKLGGKIVAKTFIQTGESNFSAQIAALKPSNPQIIYMPCYYQEMALFARQAREFGLKQTILAGDGAAEAALIKVGGSAVNGLTFTTGFAPEAIKTALGKKFEQAYMAKYKKLPDNFAALSADSYFMLVNAIDRAKSDNPVKINTALRETKNFQGITGSITLVNGDAIKPAVIEKVENGKFVYVTTINP